MNPQISVPNLGDVIWLAYRDLHAVKCKVIAKRLMAADKLALQLKRVDNRVLIDLTITKQQPLTDTIIPGNWRFQLPFYVPPMRLPVVRVPAPVSPPAP